jgi:hypothetical protein
MLSLCARIPIREDGLRKSTCSSSLAQNRSQCVRDHGFLEKELRKQEREIEKEEEREEEKEAEEDYTYM